MKTNHRLAQAQAGYVQSPDGLGWMVDHRRARLIVVFERWRELIAPMPPGETKQLMTMMLDVIEPLV